MSVIVAVMMLGTMPGVAHGYSVLAHEAIIDTVWDSDIVPMLHTRFPGATVHQLREAHAFAYGGAIIQDMGFYPFGSMRYSELTHYVRSGEFVMALLKGAKDMNEFAFAIGALSHLSADTHGHSLATNAAVPLLYPKLRKQFGDTITYQDKPSAHLQTEFGFDVLQIARGHYASQAYHDFIGFKVAEDLLERAFLETYGIKLSSLFMDLDLAIGSYRWAVSSVIPQMTRVAWNKMKSEIRNVDSTGGTSPVFAYKISRTDYESEWGTKYRKPGPFSKILSFVLRIVPKVGPLKGYAMRPPTPETERLFVKGLETIVAAYRSSLSELRAGTLALNNANLDVGKPTTPGAYRMADRAYTRLLHELADEGYANVTPALRSDILAFYKDTTRFVAKAGKDRRAFDAALSGLRNSAGSGRR